MPQVATQLLQEVAEGHEDALAELYDVFSGRMLGLILHILHFDRPAAEDALQEAFVAVWRSAHQYDARLGTAESWLLRVARSKAIDQRRRMMARGKGAASVVALDGDEDIESKGGSGDGDTVERSEGLRLAMGRLNREQAEAIQLAFFGGLTHEEVAHRLGLPLGTVKTRIRGGMMRLRELVGSIEEVNVVP